MTGPFPPYPGKPGPIDTAAELASTHAASFTAVQKGMTAGKKKARGAVDVTMGASVGLAVDPAENDAASLSRAAYLVQGACHMFSTAVSEYNSGVEDLNAAYATAKASNFGVSATTGANQCYADPADVPPGENAAAVADAGDQLLAELRKSEQALLAELDATGDDAATMLDKGPLSPDTIAMLAVFGGLPPEAFTAWPADLVADVGAATKFLKGLKKLMGGPAAIAKLRAMYRASGSAANAVQALANGVKDWDAIYDAIAKSTIDPKSAAALHAWLTGQSDIADLRAAAAAAEEAYGAASKEMMKSLGLASRLGKGLGVLGIAMTAYDGYKLVKNWDDLSTEDKVTGSIGFGAGVASSAATIAILAGASGPAAPAVLVVAGVVAGAVAVYQNWDTITEYAGKAKDWAVDRYEDARDWTGDQLSKGKDYVAGALDDARDWAGDRADDVRQGVETATDWAGDRADDVRDGLSKAAGVVDSLTPW